MHKYQISFNRRVTPISRLTITLSEPLHRALKEAAAVRGKTIEQLIDESLYFYGVIIDTNVVVAGLVTSHAEPPVATILDRILHASFRFALSEAICFYAVN